MNQMYKFSNPEAMDELFQMPPKWAVQAAECMKIELEIRFINAMYSRKSSS